jgi:hypothetical protein
MSPASDRVSSTRPSFRTRGGISFRDQVIAIGSQKIVAPLTLKRGPVTVCTVGEEAQTGSQGWG